MPIPDDAALVAFADLPGTRGLALAGSVVRGDHTRWSDVDVLRYVAGTGIAQGVAPRWIGDRLVRVSSQTMEEAWAELERPEIAIWAVLPLREMRILLDRDGEVGRLIDAPGRSSGRLWPSARGRGPPGAWRRTRRTCSSCARRSSARTSRRS